MSDGRAPIPIHGDIAEYFDKRDARCETASKVGDAIGWVDPVNNEYHLLIASGTAATTLNTELVYDIHRNKWYEMERVVDLQCGILVHDTDGNPYNYGFLDTGYMERLEYGTTFDGNSIVHTVQTGDFAMADLLTETRIGDIKLIMVAMTATASSITMTHYGDASTTGTDLTLLPYRTGYRVAQPIEVDKMNGDPFHCIKIAMTTTDETIGFEPLALAMGFQTVSSRTDY